jgi:adenylate kinase family enzyme
MRRVLILGNAGSGKSTVARRLHAVTGLPLVHLDTHYWKPGWVPSAPEEWIETVELLAGQEHWIMDGGYSNTLFLRLPRADTVLFLDIPRRVCLFRVLCRRIAWRGRSRPDMAFGCHEKLDFAFLKLVWGYPTRTRRKLLAELEALRGSKAIVVLRSSREIDDFLLRQEMETEREPRRCDIVA